MSEQRVVGDYVTLRRGKTYKGALVGAPGPALLGLGSIVPGGGFRNDFKTYGGDCPPELMLAPGDLYVSLKGATKDGEMIGSVARLPSTVSSGRLTQDTVRLIPHTRDQAFARYIYWLLRTPDYRSYCAGRATGSAVVALSRNDFLAYPVPPLTASRSAIVDVLESLDDKIESNRRISDLVLDLAVAIYRGAVSEGADSMPLRDTGRWISGGTPNTSTADYWGGDLPWISASSLKSFYLWDSDRRLTEAGASAAKYVVPAGTLLFVVRGMSLKTEFRLGVSQRTVAFGQDCKAIVPRVPVSVLSIALQSSRDEILDLVDEAGHGTGRLSTDLLAEHFVQIPRDPSVVATLDSLIARGGSAHAEATRLAYLRDALLPELLSGRIRVPIEESVA